MSNILITKYPAKALARDINDFPVGEALVRVNDDGKYEIFIISKDRSRAWKIFTHRWTPKSYASIDRAIRFLEESGIPEEKIAVHNGKFIWLHKNNQEMANMDKLFSMIA
ncbi:hypothetical protein [uncultured Microbulbifer sp.]|uniref:hypothetical protein n=1 Tax=uncultured Microbulbifer sp. TaxID=348147 RepID=UPI0026132A55|nr:hypothetical protein [uncultured Microbulbifer sp.]